MSNNNSTTKRPLLEVVHDILKKNKQPKTFYELTDMLPKAGATNVERAEYIARLYTNMNLDGRFLSIGDNFWGLRSWYPVEQREEEVAITLAPKRRKKKKKKKKDDYDDFDDYDDIDEDIDEVDDDYEDDDFDDDDDDDDFDDEFEKVKVEDTVEDDDDTDDDINDLEEDLDEDEEEK